MIVKQEQEYSMTRRLQGNISYDVIFLIHTCGSFHGTLKYHKTGTKLAYYWVAYGKPSRGLRFVCLFSFFSFFFFFPVSVKVLPVTPLVSGVFVHRAFCAYFLRIERVVELRRFH